MEYPFRIFQYAGWGPPQTPARALALLANTPFGVAGPQAELVVLLPPVASFPQHFARKTAAAAAKGLTRATALSYDKDTGRQRRVSVKALKQKSAPVRIVLRSFQEGCAVKP